MRRLDVRRTFQPVRRVLKKFKRFEADVQQTREKLVKDLLQAVRIAHDRAMDPDVSDKDRMKAAKLCAYLAQRINSILRDYDMMEIEKDIENLQRKLKELQEEAE